jgi:hypothetical protein
MDFNEQTQPQQDDSARHLNDMAAVGENMVGWLKFLGVVNIIMGVFVALSIVGILVAWLPIWLGVLLFQAGNQITEARVSRKFKMYFMIQGILLLISLIFAVIGFLSFGAAIIGAFGNGDFNTY